MANDGIKDQVYLKLGHGFRGSDVKMRKTQEHKFPTGTLPTEFEFPFGSSGP